MSLFLITGKGVFITMAFSDRIMERARADKRTIVLAEGFDPRAVSYTHLDVYKRQDSGKSGRPGSVDGNGWRYAYGCQRYRRTVWNDFGRGADRHFCPRSQKVPVGRRMRFENDKGMTMIDTSLRLTVFNRGDVCYNHRV